MTERQLSLDLSKQFDILCTNKYTELRKEILTKRRNTWKGRLTKSEIHSKVMNLVRGYLQMKGLIIPNIILKKVVARGFTDSRFGYHYGARSIFYSRKLAIEFFQLAGLADESPKEKE